jgi:branched-chain amino acid transport system ATP-binding protein
MLKIDRLCRYFGGVKAVHQVSFDVASGEIYGLIGPNGAGKTTLFNAITGHGRATAGDVFFKQKRITQMPPHRITSLGIARTFQNIRIFKEMSVIENVMIGAHCRTHSGLWGAIMHTHAMMKEEQLLHDKSSRILDFVNLSAHAYECAQNLPYGAQRKLELARALASEPELLLLDEPAAGMNPSETQELMSLIRNISAQKITILLIEHHMKVVMNICDRLTVLDYGEKICEGKPEEIRRNPKVIEAYLGTKYSVA